MNSSKFLQALGQASLQMALAFGFVFLICAVFPKIGPAVRCWLWRLVLLKGLVSLFWVAEVPLLASSSAPVTTHIPLPELTAIPPQIGLSSRAIESSTAWDPTTWIGVICLAGIVVGFARLFGWAIQTRVPRSSKKLVDLPEAEEVAKSSGLRRIPEIRSSEFVQTPFVTGVFRFRVIIPESIEGDLRPILAHEFAHIRRRDLLWDILAASIRAVFWFHPLAWLAAQQARLEAEIACDVIALSQSCLAPRAYGQLVVQFASAQGRQVWGRGLSFGSKRNLESRLKAMGKEFFDCRSLRQFFAACLVPCAFALIPWTLGEAEPAGVVHPSTASVFVQSGQDSYWNSGTLLLSDPAVRNEIGMTDEQVKGMNEASEQFQIEIRALGEKLAEFAKQKTSNRERYEYDRKERPAIYERASQKTLELLSPQQRSRLTELALQKYGLSQLRFPKVAQQVGIAESKRSQIERLVRAFQDDSRRRSRELDHHMFDKLYTRIRDLTPAETRQLAKINNELVTARGKKRDALYDRMWKLQDRARKPKKMTSEMEDEMRKDYARAHLAARAVNDREQFRMETQIRSLLSKGESARWKGLLGKPFTFTALESVKNFVWQGGKYAEVKSGG